MTILLAILPLSFVSVAVLVRVHAFAMTLVFVPFAAVMIAGRPIHSCSVAFLARNAIQVVGVWLRKLLKFTMVAARL